MIIRLLLLGCFLFSCTKLKTYKMSSSLSTAHLQSPEVQGDFLAGHIKIYGGSTTQLTHFEAEQTNASTGSTSNAVLITETGFYDSEFSAGLQFSLGLHERVSLDIRKNFEGLLLYGGQVQYLGSPLKEKEVGYKGSFSLHYGSYRNEEVDASESGGLYSSDNDRFFSASGEEYQQAYSIAVNHGYRKDQKLLFYWNNSYSSHRYEGIAVLNNSDRYSLDKKGEVLGRQWNEA